MCGVEIHAGCWMTAVEGIAEDWKTSGCKVNTDLMRATCVKSAFYKKT
jgi:hypothetical protein